MFPIRGVRDGQITSRDRVRERVGDVVVVEVRCAVGDRYVVRERRKAPTVDGTAAVRDLELRFAEEPCADTSDERIVVDE
jgi:hypothetical protein